MNIWEVGRNLGTMGNPHRHKGNLWNPKQTVTWDQNQIRVSEAVRQQHLLWVIIVPKKKKNDTRERSKNTNPNLLISVWCLFASGASGNIFQFRQFSFPALLIIITSAFYIHISFCNLGQCDMVNYQGSFEISKRPWRGNSPCLHRIHGNIDSGPILKWLIDEPVFSTVSWSSFINFFQLHIMVSPSSVKLNLDCQQVAEKEIKEAGNTSADGYQVLGKMSKSIGSKGESATVSEAFWIYLKFSMWACGVPFFHLLVYIFLFDKCKTPRWISQLQSLSFIFIWCF